MRHRYTDEQYEFIRNNCKGRTTYEITEIFNKYFHTDLTRSQIKSYITNHDLKSDIDRKLLNQFRKKIYTKEQIQFLKDNIKGLTSNELTKLINEQFNLNLEVSQIRALKNRYKLKNDLNTQFKKGLIPSNKGKKGMPSHPNAVATQFKKGQKPKNFKSIGTERINVDGYTEIKVANPGKWRLKHVVLWEEYNGKTVPKGSIVIFGDRNKTNFNQDNLILVTKAELCKLNQLKLLKNEIEFTKSGVLIADIHLKIGELRRKNKELRKQIKSGESSNEE